MDGAQRDAQGRFLPGWVGGPGRPSRAREEQYMEALVESVPLVRFLKMCQVHAARAEAGDLATFRTFLERLLGKPRESKEIRELSESLSGLLLNLQDASDGEGSDGEPDETTG